MLNPNLDIPALAAGFACLGCRVTETWQAGPPASALGRGWPCPAGYKRKKS